MSLLDASKSRQGCSSICFALLLVSLCLTACADDALPKNWKTECVGRYTISLPGEVEYALVSIPSILEQNASGSYRFKDGQVANYVDINVGGPLYVSPSVSQADFDELITKRNVQTIKRKKEVEKQFGKDAADNIQVIGTSSSSSHVLHGGGSSIQYYFYKDQKIYFWSAKGSDETLPQNLQLLELFKTNFRTRTTFDTPPQNGICVPYGFIADDGKQLRHVAVSMRLKEHPDVTVFFQDSSNKAPGNRSATEQIEQIWQYWYRDKAKSVALGFPMTHFTKIAGRIGKSSFGEMINNDGTTDYGYVAAVEAEPGAKTDTPNLVITVIRTAANTKGTLTTEKELKDLAQKIAASIKRR